jgi:predicted transcriptional regulator
MKYEERIRQERPFMSKSFAKLADFLLDSYIEAAFMTASELAHTLDLDAATVVRFAQHLGYTGFPKLQREIRERVRADLLVRPEQARIEDSLAGVVTRAMSDLSIALEQTRISLDTDEVTRLVEKIGPGGGLQPGPLPGTRRFSNLHRPIRRRRPGSHGPYRHLPGLAPGPGSLRSGGLYRRHTARGAPEEYPHRRHPGSSFPGLCPCC